MSSASCSEVFVCWMWPCSSTSRRLTILLLLVVALVGTSVAQSGKYVFLDRTRWQVHVRDVATDAETATISAGQEPTALVVSPNGRTAFVANGATPYLSVLDLDAGIEVTRISTTPHTPTGSLSGVMAVNQPGTLVAVLENIDTLAPDILLIDTQKMSVKGTVSIDPARGFFTGSQPVFAAGKLYVSIVTPANVSVLGIVDLSTLGITVTTTSSAFDLAVTSDEQFVVSVGGNGTSLIVTDAQTNQVAATIQTPPNSVRFATSPDGSPSFAYLLHQDGFGFDTPGGLSIVDLRTGSPTFATIISTVPLSSVANSSGQGRVTPTTDGTRIVVRARIDLLIELDAALALTNPTAAIVKTFDMPEGVYSIAAGPPSRPKVAAPTVTSVSPPSLINDAATTLTITGSGFANGAMVRVGHGDLLPAQTITNNSLTVSLPARQPSGIVDVLVENPNSTSPVGDQWRVGRLRGALRISNFAGFQTSDEVFVSNFGSASYSSISSSPSGVFEIPLLFRPLPLSFSQDATHLWATHTGDPGVVVDNGVSVFNNIETGQLQTTLTFDQRFQGSVGGPRGLAASRDPRTGSPVMLYTANAEDVNAPPGQQLFVADADPSSLTFGSVIDTLFATSPIFALNGAMVVTPDGRFVYSSESDLIETGALFVFDLLTASTTRIDVAPLGLNLLQNTMDISPDGRVLVAFGPGGTVLLDIATDPLAPRVITTLPPLVPATLISGVDARFQGNNRLFEFDPATGTAYAFDLDFVNNVFTQLFATSVFPGTGFNGSSTFEIAISKDGTILYVPDVQRDALVALSTSALLSGTDPVLAVIGTGVGPSGVAIRPGFPTTAGTSLAIPISTGSTITFPPVSVTGSTSAAIINTPPVPADQFTFSDPPSITNISSTAQVSLPATVCLHYDPAAFASTTRLALMHLENGAWVNITTSINTGGQQVCGATSGLGAFTVVALDLAPVAVSAPATSGPGQQVQVVLTVPIPYREAVNATVTVTFTSATANLSDPSIGFPDGKVITIAIPAGFTGTKAVPLAVGTLQGIAATSLSVATAQGTVDVTPATGQFASTNVPASTPVISTVTLTRSGNTLTVDITGFANTREITSASFHFTPAAGQSLFASDLTVVHGDVFATWFQSAASAINGSNFTYSQTFTLDGDSSGVGSVAVTLNNAAGTSNSQSAQ